MAQSDSAAPIQATLLAHTDWDEPMVDAFGEEGWARPLEWPALAALLWSSPGPGPPGAIKRHSRFTVKRLSMAFLYGRAGRFTAFFGGSRPGQWTESSPPPSSSCSRPSAAWRA